MGGIGPGVGFLVSFVELKASSKNNKTDNNSSTKKGHTYVSKFLGLYRVLTGSERREVDCETVSTVDIDINQEWILLLSTLPLLWLIVASCYYHVAAA